MFKIIHEDKNPMLMIVTPLRPEDKISKKTKITIKRNEIPFIWGYYQGKGNVVQNFKAGLKEFDKYLKKLPPFTIKVDNDTIWNRKTFDKMLRILEISPDNIAYAYCSFSYRGAVTADFPAIPFDPTRLRQNNYISSNSIFKTGILKKFEPIDDNKYQRLLDWAYYLRLLNNKYIGIPTDGYFTALAGKNSISAGSNMEFHQKRMAVLEDFCKQ